MFLANCCLSCSGALFRISWHPDSGPAHGAGFKSLHTANFSHTVFKATELITQRMDIIVLECWRERGGFGGH